MTRQQARAQARADAFRRVNAAYGLEPRKARRGIARAWARKEWRSRGVMAALSCGLLALFSFSAAKPLHAQGSRKDDVVFNAQGRPMAGAMVRVCTSAATGQPCLPLAPIYSDLALTQALANPVSADGLGNYTFYAAPGLYEIEISGPGITTKQIPNVILPSNPSSPTFTTVTTTSGISAFSLSLSGNLTVTGSTSVSGTLSVGGAPVPSTGADNEWSGNQRFKGPTPWRDFTAYMQQGGVQIPGGCSSTSSAYNPTGNGTISAGSTTLTLSSAQDFKNGCDITIFAGPASPLPPPQGSCTISSVTESGNTVTATCAAAHNMILSGAGVVGQGVQISGVSVSGYNGTFPLASTPTANTFTYSIGTTGLATSSGGTATENWGYAHGVTGSTSVKYQVMAVDAFGGVSAAGPTISIANSNATLTTNNYNWITYGASASGALVFPDILYNRARMYLIYSDKGLGGALSCVGTSFTVGYADFGLPMPCPIQAPATPGPVQQLMRATITAGGGTTTLTLGTAASTTVTGVGVWHDNTRFLEQCLSDAVSDQAQGFGGTLSGAGSWGCYVPYGMWAFNYKMPTDRASATCTYCAANGGGMHIQFAGSPQFAVMPWIFNTTQWNIDSVGNAAQGIQFTAFPSIPVTTSSTLPALFVLEGGANNMSISGLSALNLYGDGVWMGSSNPYNGGAPAAVKLSKMALSENSAGGGAPVVFDSNVIGITMDQMYLGPNPNGLDAILWTQTDYSDGFSCCFYISNITGNYRGLKFDAPGGNGGQGGDNSIFLNNVVWENYVSASTVPGFVELDSGPNATGNVSTNPLPLLGIYMSNFNFSDATSGPNAYSQFVANGANAQIVGSLGGITAVLSCLPQSTACNVGGDRPALNTTGSDDEIGATYGGGGGQLSNEFEFGLPVVQRFSENEFTNGGLWWVTEFPPPSSFQVTGIGAGSLTGGTYCMEVVGEDHQATPGLTKPSAEVCQTVSNSSQIDVQWKQGQSNSLITTYGSGWRFYFGTAGPGSENQYFNVTGTGSPVGYFFTSASGAISGQPPATTSAYMNWLSPTQNSCLLCTGAPNGFTQMLGLGQPTPAEKLDVFGGINAAKYYRANETTAPTCVAAEDFFWADSTAHLWKKCENNGAAFNVSGTLAGTSGAIGGSALTAGQCASGTVSVSGATTNMTVSVSPNTYPGDGMIPWGYVSASGTVTLKVCAQAAGTPVSSTYNVRVIQ